jgi:hypothetical protein
VNGAKRKVFVSADLNSVDPLKTLPKIKNKYCKTKHLHVRMKSIAFSLRASSYNVKGSSV